jgi:hypothetical protein
MDMSDLIENPKEPDKAAGYAALCKAVEAIAWSSAFYDNFSPAQQVTGSIGIVTRWQQST